MLKSLGKALVLIRNESSMSGPTQHVNVFVFGPFLFAKNLQEVVKVAEHSAVAALSHMNPGRGKTMVYPEEREAYINIDYFNQTFGIYTNNATVIKRLIAKGLYPADGSTLSPEEIEKLEYIDIRDLPLENIKVVANAAIFRAE